jgi:hypothetical protein
MSLALFQNVNFPSVNVTFALAAAMESVVKEKISAIVVRIVHQGHQGRTVQTTKIMNHALKTLIACGLHQGVVRNHFLKH